MTKKRIQKSANTETEIHISFSADAFFSSGIRDFVFTLTKNLTHFPDTWAFRFQSVVDELCNNAIEHGSKKNAMVNCIFRISPHEYFEGIIEDEGRDKQEHAEEIKTKLLNSQKKDIMGIFGIRGRGLSHIVVPIMDEVEFSNRPKGGLSVRVRKYLNRCSSCANCKRRPVFS